MSYAAPLPVDPSTASSEDEAAALRRDAADKLMNIGLEERERRGEAGKIFYVLTSIYAVYASLVLDDGGVGGHIARLAVALVSYLMIVMTGKIQMCNPSHLLIALSTMHEAFIF